MIPLGGGGPPRQRAALREVRPPVEIPDDVHPDRIRAHAERMTVLARAVSLAGVWDARMRRRHGTELGDLHLIGVALSWQFDLEILEPTWQAVREAAFPTGTAGGYGRSRFRDAIRVDVPTYEPEYGGKCPITGPRGGRCRAGWAGREKWVTDMDTGDWEWRDMCREHRDIALRRQMDAPLPPPTHGGVLMQVFHDLNIDAVYQWVSPRWTPAVGVDQSPSLPPPRLVLRGLP